MKEKKIKVRVDPNHLAKKTKFHGEEEKLRKKRRERRQYNEKLRRELDD